MPMKYGLFLPQGWRMDLADVKDPMEAYETMTRVAQAAEECGYESVWLIDHFHTVAQPSQESIFLIDHFHTVAQPSQEPTFECWTTTAALARDTSRIRIGQMVTCNNYRNPALLAKMASTVDVLSHGRLNFGIGAGWYEQEYRAYGYDFPEAPVRLRQLGEAVQIILAMWTQKEATFEGTYYQVRGAINQPQGVQKPHIPLLIGGSGEKVTLKLVAQFADACNMFGDPASLERKFAILQQHCQTVGRDYESIHRTAGVMCLIADTDEQALAQVPDAIKAQFGDRIYSLLIGSPETLRKRLPAYEAAGVQEMLLIVPTLGPALLEMIQRFAQEFIA